MIDTDKMKALALKVGGVEWYEGGDSVCLPDGDTIACCQSSIGHMPEPIHYDDMVEYLVSVSPAKILKLIDAFEAAEREREQLRAELEAAAAFVQDVSKQKPERPDYWSSCSQCEHNIDRAQDLLEKQAALSQRQEES
ncbi:hypothetical protein [Burkholderia sp. CCA53]|uniref:hypothetical protein n=1 Tax=Burkholderia sp. CCA53 TaxID=1776288 RepID=UPI0020C82A21|nr:hypothetical protein [Burkholderia sp. CCA53]